MKTFAITLVVALALACGYAAVSESAACIQGYNCPGDTPSTGTTTSNTTTGEALCLRFCDVWCSDQRLLTTEDCLPACMAFSTDEGCRRGLRVLR